MLARSDGNGYDDGMIVTIEATVVCTIEDGLHLLKLARQEVETTKSSEDWELFYPETPTDALQLLIRQAIAQRLLTCGGVVLHEIGHQVKSLDMPLES